MGAEKSRACSAPWPRFPAKDHHRIDFKWSPKLVESNVFLEACMGLRTALFVMAALGTALQGADINVGGSDRSYDLSVPAGKGPWPLVMALHGGGGRASRMERLTGLGALGAKEGFAVVYPEAQGRHWNDGRTDFQLESVADDVAFLMALRSRLVAEHVADPTRIYLCGISNGGLMALRMACEQGGLFAAVGVVAMNMSAAYDCYPPISVPICFIDGDTDPLVPHEGGEIRLFKRGKPRGRVRSFEDSLAFWAKVNHAMSHPEVMVLQPLDPKDACSVERWHYETGPQGAEVLAYLVKGGGHAWPGGWKYLPEFLVGKRTNNLDASAALWQFFSRNQRPASIN
jgi:polyhydroxybutyrate depolymerase